MSDLKDNIATSLRELNKLHNSLSAGSEKDEVYKQILALTKQAEAMRDKTLDQRMAEYAEATKAVEKAIEAIKEAHKNIANVSDAINKVTKAIDLIGKFLIAIGFA